MTEATTNWQDWHRAYDDPDSRLSQRLGVVQTHVRAALDERAAQPAPIRIISMCAGQGRDVIGALADHPRRHEVTAVLVELDEGLAQAARTDARDSGINGLRVLCADASVTDSYEGAAPADIVLACGIFGNISNDDIQRTIAHLPMLCAPGATVIWTRYGRPGDDLAPDICRWFAACNFDLLTLDASDERSFRVGSHRLTGDPARLEHGIRLFTFFR